MDFKKIIVNVILYGIIEIIFYYFLIYIFIKIGLNFHKPLWKNNFFCLSILYSVYIFSIIIMVKNVLFEILKKYSLQIAIISFLMFFFLVQNIKYQPYRSLLFISSAFVVFTLKFLWSKYAHATTTLNIKTFKP